MINKFLTDDYHNIVEAYLGKPTYSVTLNEQIDESLPITSINIFVTDDPGMFRKDISASVQSYNETSDTIEIQGIDIDNNRSVFASIFRPDDIRVTVKTPDNSVEMEFTNGKQLKFGGEEDNILNILKPEELQ